MALATINLQPYILFCSHIIRQALTLVQRSASARGVTIRGECWHQGGLRTTPLALCSALSLQLQSVTIDKGAESKQNEF
jgi:hypothetical protein